MGTVSSLSNREFLDYCINIEGLKYPLKTAIAFQNFINQPFTVSVSLLGYKNVVDRSGESFLIEDIAKCFFRLPSIFGGFQHDEEGIRCKCIAYKVHLKIKALYEEADMVLKQRPLITRLLSGDFEERRANGKIDRTEYYRARLYNCWDGGEISTPFQIRDLFEISLLHNTQYRTILAPLDQPGREKEFLDQKYYFISEDQMKALAAHLGIE